MKRVAWTNPVFLMLIIAVLCLSSPASAENLKDFDELPSADLEAVLSSGIGDLKDYQHAWRSGSDQDPEQSGLKIPLTEDVVTIREDGRSLMIDTGAVALQTTEAFGWIYFTQDVVTQWDLYAAWDLSLAEALIGDGTHLYLSDLMTKQLTIQWQTADMTGLQAIVRDMDALNEKEEAVVAEVMRRMGWKDVSIHRFGDHRYVRISDGLDTYGVMLYETVKNDVPCFILLQSKAGALSDREIAETEKVISAFAFSAR